MNRWERLKPYSNDPLYIASKKCKVGGFVVVYDYFIHTATEPKPPRWAAIHQPSGARKMFKTVAEARGFMVSVAKSARLDHIEGYFTRYENEFLKLKAWIQLRASSKSST